MVILRTRNKITDFFMILAWASPFNKGSNSSFEFIGNHACTLLKALLFPITCIIFLSDQKAQN